MTLGLYRGLYAVSDVTGGRAVGDAAVSGLRLCQEVASVEDAGRKVRRTASRSQVRWRRTTLSRQSAAGT